MSWDDSDNKEIRGPVDQAWVSTSEEYEVTQAAKTWLSSRNFNHSESNVLKVETDIINFPDHLKSNGRIGREDLYAYLDKKYVK